MTDFLINGTDLAVGEMTVQQQLVNGKIIVSGVMELDQYIDDIIKIQTEAFYITGVSIIKETVGTLEKKVAYEFTGSDLFVNKEYFNRKEVE